MNQLESTTPIFDTLKTEQKFDWPRPEFETHDTFLVRHEYPAFMARAELILLGVADKPEKKASTSVKKVSPRKQSAKKADAQ